jgi:hypothetical protein
LQPVIAIGQQAPPIISPVHACHVHSLLHLS